MPQTNVYQAIVAPLLPLLRKEVTQLKADDYSLSLYFFCMNLCYAIIAGIGSIRLLITEAKTSMVQNTPILGNTSTAISSSK